MALEGVSALPREGGLEALEGGRGLCSAQTRRAERGDIHPLTASMECANWQPAESACGGSTVTGSNGSVVTVDRRRLTETRGVNGNREVTVDRRRSTADNDRRGLSKRLSHTGSSPEATPETTKSEMNCNCRRVGRVGRREAVSACDRETADLRAKGKALYLAVGP